MNPKRPLKMPLMAHHFPSITNPFENHLNEYMFIKDIQLGIMPIGRISQRSKEYNASLKGSDVDQELAIKVLNSLRSHNHYSELGELVAEVVQTIVENMSWSGRSFYEIIEDKEDPCCPYLHRFTSKNLLKLPGWFVQIIPKKDIGFFNRRFSIIKSFAVWEINFPVSLGGYRFYQNILKKLRSTDSITPKFAQNNIELVFSTPGYDSKTYNRDQDIFINKLTTKYGWNRRNIHLEYYTEFYSIYKHLTFSWVKSILREHVINELNKLLTRLSIHCSIEISGLPNSDDIKKGRDNLLNGKIDFDEALKLTSIY